MGVGVVLLVAGIFLVAILALLAVPVSAAFDLDWRGDVKASVDLKLWFGLIQTRIQSPAASGDTRDKTIMSQPQEPCPGNNDGFGRIPNLLRQKPLISRILTYARRTWRAVDREEIRLRMRLGLGDPADTGRLWAVVGPIAGALAGVSAGKVEIEPEFFDSVFEAQGQGTIRFVPLQLIILALTFCLSPVVWRGIRQLRATPG